MGGIYEGAEMDSGAMTYIQSLVEIGSGIQKLIGGLHSVEIAQAYFRFFKIRKVGKRKTSFHLLQLVSFLVYSSNMKMESIFLRNVEISQNHMTLEPRTPHSSSVRPV
jgi:hypothetical protein